MNHNRQFQAHKLQIIADQVEAHGLIAVLAEIAREARSEGIEIRDELIEAIAVEFERDAPSIAARLRARAEAMR